MYPNIVLFFMFILLPALSTLDANVEEVEEYTPKVPPECIGKPFCNRTLNLPDGIEEFVKKIEKDIRNSKLVILASLVVKRGGGQNEEFYLCPSERVPLQLGSILIDVSGNPRLILLPRNLKITASLCANNNKSEQCANDYVTVEPHEHYVKECTQQAYVVTGLVYSVKKGKPTVENDTFIWNVGCKCIIKPE